MQHLVSQAASSKTGCQGNVLQVHNRSAVFNSQIRISILVTETGRQTDIRAQTHKQGALPMPICSAYRTQSDRHITALPVHELSLKALKNSLLHVTGIYKELTADLHY